VSGARAPWRVGEWGLLGWTETVLKGAGAGVGLAAGATALGAPADGPSGVRWAQVAVLAALSLGLVVAIADRLLEREVVGMAFIPLMVAGHLGMTVALARDPGADTALVAFAALMLAGDLVKLIFLVTTGFRVRDVPRGAVLGLTGAYAAGYAALLVMQAAA
jgi:hypothetical protein